MANAADISNFVDANFHLLTDNDEMNEILIDGDITPEAIAQVENIIQQAQLPQNEEMQHEDNDFIGPLLPGRHVSASAQKVDEYANESNAPATHTQTKWAVNVLRGKFHISQSIFLQESGN